MATNRTTVIPIGIIPIIPIIPIINFVMFFYGISVMVSIVFLLKHVHQGNNIHAVLHIIDNI